MLKKGIRLTLIVLISILLSFLIYWLIFSLPPGISGITATTLVYGVVIFLFTYMQKVYKKTSDVEVLFYKTFTTIYLLMAYFGHIFFDLWKVNHHASDILISFAVIFLLYLIISMER